MLRFIHAADFHLDSAFAVHSSIGRESNSPPGEPGAAGASG